MTESSPDKITYSVSLVTQGKHKFYTLSMPSDVLARCSTVDTREDDPVQGFQRKLDAKRAAEIADYIDNGLGTIPSSIVLSAQPEAELAYSRSRRSITFSVTPKSFLILDGQHRVFGFSKATNQLRVPVVIYNNLTRADECRLFIDINTKQRPVPNALLLDIKRLAETESDEEEFYREVFDLLANDAASPLLGRMSAANVSKNKLSRVTFNAAMKSLRSLLQDVGPERGYRILAAYLTSCMNGLRDLKCEDRITNPTVFRAVMLLFHDVVQRVNAKHGSSYESEHFDELLGPLFEQVKASSLKSPGQSHTKLYEIFQRTLKQQFKIT